MKDKNSIQPLKVILLVIFVSAGGCGGDDSSGSSESAFAAQVSPESSALVVADNGNLFEKIMNGLFIQVAYAAQTFQVPSLTFGPGDVDDEPTQFVCDSYYDDGSCQSGHQEVIATGCSALDATDTQALYPLTYANGQPYSFTPELAEGTKFLILALGGLDGSSEGTETVALPGGGWLDKNKPLNSDGTSACRYGGTIAITGNWTFTLQKQGGGTCNTATLSTAGQSDGAAVIEVTGSGETCEVWADGQDRLGAIQTTAAEFVTVPVTDAPVIESLLFDTKELPLDEPVTVSLKNPINPVDTSWGKAMQFEVVSDEIQDTGTFWKSSNGQSGTDNKKYDWVITPTTQNVLLTARKTGGNVLSQKKFLVQPE